MNTMDLNSDLGEGFGPYRSADDTEMIKCITSANVACGFHAGDPEIMAATFKAAKERNIAVGAHPGFPDLWGFGRRRIPFSAAEIERLVAYQIGAAQALATHVGHRITHVKPHGALGNLTETEPDIADAVTNAIYAVDRKLICLVIANSLQYASAARRGMTARTEICADRAYDDGGRLVSRSLPGAVIHDPATASARTRRMVENGAVETVGGRWIKTPIDSVCVHSDTPSASAIASAVRAELEAAGYTMRAFA